MPESFKREYPNNKQVIIDAIEIYIEQLSSLLPQASTFSAYKNDNTNF